MGYVDTVDRIYARGADGQTGFIGSDYYATYLAWRQYAIDTDAGNPLAPAAASTQLESDRLAGRFDYSRGYLPLYNLFILEQVDTPAPGPGTGGIPVPRPRTGPGGNLLGLSTNTMLLVGAAVLAIVLMRK